MEEEILKWLKTNKIEIEELDKIREIGTKNIEKKEKELKILLEEKLKINFIKIWKGNMEIACYIDSPFKYHVDAILGLEGWKIGLFTLSVVKGNEIKQILLNSNYDILEDDGKHKLLYKYEYNTSIEEISNKVIEIYQYMENALKK